MKSLNTELFVPRVTTVAAACLPSWGRKAKLDVVRQNIKNALSADSFNHLFPRLRQVRAY
jgi:hypothetical protein